MRKGFDRGEGFEFSRRAPLQPDSVVLNDSNNRTGGWVRGGVTAKQQAGPAASTNWAKPKSPATWTTPREFRTGKQARAGKISTGKTSGSSSVVGVSNRSVVGFSCVHVEGNGRG